MRRTLATLTLATLLVLSGCSLGPGDSGPSPTSQAGDSPPGIENGTLTNASALLSAHTRLLNQSGFETDVQTNATVNQSGRVRQIARQQQVIVEPGNSAYVYRTTNPESQFDVWSNGTVVVTRAQAGNQTRYRTGSNVAPVSVLGGERLLRRYLSKGTYEVTGTTEAEGRTFTTLTATSPPAEPALPSGASNVSNYSSTVVVDAEGRVHSFDVRAEYTIDGERGRYHVGFDLVRTDEPTVERPDWVAEALS